MRERAVYDVLSFISDTGGLYGGLLSIFSTFLIMINAIYDFSLESHLVKSIFIDGE